MAKTTSNPELYKSTTHDWWTPPELLEAILNIHKIDKFSCDPCASLSKNTPSEIHYTVEDNGLDKPWPKKGVIFVNPPYGALLKKFVLKCFNHYKENPLCTIYLLLPVRSENKFYHDYIYSTASLTFFFAGKMKFGKEGVFKDPAPFPVQLSCFGSIDVYTPNEYGEYFSSVFPFKGTTMVRCLRQ